VSTAGATALYNKLDPNGDGKLTMQDLNKAGHHHGHHGGAGGLMNSDALGAVLGGQESATATSPGGLLSDISTAVQKAISGYFGTQQSSLA
ncbi:MAG: hypothetical protein M3Y41_05065, partial [Pseudomonadota bacterium]|nr:hypothetical protein [Pseudomonadota bacterium]